MSSSLATTIAQQCNMTFWLYSFHFGYVIMYHKINVFTRWAVLQFFLKKQDVPKNLIFCNILWCSFVKNSFLYEFDEFCRIELCQNLYIIYRRDKILYDYKAVDFWIWNLKTQNENSMGLKIMLHNRPSSLSKKRPVLV